MVDFHSRRLQLLLGAPVNALTATLIEAMTESRVSEDFDLDFKSELYSKSDKGRRDLASDVAAMANSSGGIIILGVEEDDQAQAVATPGVPLSDAETLRMRQVIASIVAPMPEFAILTVPTPSDADRDAHSGDADTVPVSDTPRGFYILAVPRSTRAPHAAVVNEGLRFPRRNGASTRYLTEAEVAAAYRDRFAGAEAQARRIQRVEEQAISHLDRTDGPWVLVSLVPDLVGDLAIDATARQNFSKAVKDQMAFEIRPGLYGAAFRRISVGHRRLIADGGYSSPRAEHASLEVHADGAGAYALQLREVRGPESRTMRPIEGVSMLVSDEAVTLGILTGLSRLCDHALNRTGAAGNALVRARIVPGIGAEATPLLGHARGVSGGARAVVSGDPTTEVAESVVDMDEVVTHGPSLVTAAADLANQLAQAFGVAEMGHLTRKGGVRLNMWKRDAVRDVADWAQEHGINLVEDGFFE